MKSFFYKFFSEYIFYIFIIVLSAQSFNFLENKLFIILIFLYTSIVFSMHYRKVELPIRIILTFWFFINLLAYLYHGNIPGVKLITFLSVTARLVLPYLYLKILGNNFFNNIEKTILILTTISIPIFIVQYYFPDVLYSLSPALNKFTISEQQDNGGWYIGLYMFNGWAPERNSGFMWEPGAFAFMIIIGIVLRLSKNRMQLDKQIIIYLFAIFTTFSTMGYIAISFILLLFILKTKNIIIYLILPIVLGYGYNKFGEVDFLLPKIETYYEESENIGRSSEESGDILRFNRFGILKYAFEESIKWPFGYGVLEDTPAHIKYNESVRGPNTYAQLLLRWGWLGLLLFLIAFYKFVKNSFHMTIQSFHIFIYLSLLSSVFSYGLLNNSLLLMILYSPYIIQYTNNQFNKL